LPYTAVSDFVQGDDDNEVADTVDLDIAVWPNAVAGQCNVQMDLYVFNDGNTLIGASAAFHWNEPSLELDSARFSPYADSIFDMMSFVYRNNSRDSSNQYQGFTFTGLTITPPGFPPRPARALWASYYFTLEDWNTGDSFVVDTIAWTDSHVLEFAQGTAGASYRPYWAGSKVIKYTAPPCCVLRTGDASCSGSDEPTIGDFNRIVDFLFISYAPLCCVEEADVNQSGGANPTAADVTIGDASYLQDYLFMTGPSLGLPDCF
jgi:hypothetical protein